MCLYSMYVCMHACMHAYKNFSHLCMIAHTHAELLRFRLPAFLYVCYLVFMYKFEPHIIFHVKYTHTYQHRRSTSDVYIYTYTQIHTRTDLELNFCASVAFCNFTRPPGCRACSSLASISSNTLLSASSCMYVCMYVCMYGYVLFASVCT